MKLFIRIALLSTLLAILTHGYLTYQYYPLKFGMGASESLCNFSETFNCDAVSASRYSSFLGIPMSVWGGITNLVLFLMILMSWLGLTDHPKRLLRWAFVLAGLTAVSSVVMGIISVTSIGTYCLFCIFLYILSFITFGVLLPAQQEPVASSLKTDFSTLFGESKSILIAFIAIPVVAFITHKAIMQRYGADKLENMAKAYIHEWKANPQNQFSVEPSLVKGPPASEAKMVLAEFADFRCGHCKHAAPSLHAFARSHKDVRFEFYTFPLDGECNPAIPRGDGISCRLSKAVYCGSQQNVGWDLHKRFFDEQSKYQNTHSVSEIDNSIRTLASEMNFNADELVACMDKSETHELIVNQAKAGEKANVKGTPTIFVDGKKLPGGQLIPILQRAYRSL